MKFEDALRKVLNESEEDMYEFAKRVPYNYPDFSRFLDGEHQLPLSQVQRVYDALSAEDKEKWHELAKKPH